MCAPLISCGKYRAFLPGGAPARNLVDAKIGIGAVGQAYGSARAADFFNGHAMRQVSHARATVIFGNGNAVQTQGSHFLP